MSDIEILAYSPLDMEDFLDYVVQGLKDEHGNPRKDRLDRFITGVIPWLHGREIPEAHSFSTNPGDPVRLFVATVRGPEHEEEEVPWMRDVPGLEDMVRVDGLLGSAPEFPATISNGTPVGFVVPRPELDAIFNAGRDRIRDLDFEKLPFTKEEFLAALKGDRETNLREQLETIESQFSVKLLDTPASPVLDTPASPSEKTRVTTGS